MRRIALSFSRLIFLAALTAPFSFSPESAHAMDKDGEADRTYRTIVSSPLDNALKDVAWKNLGSKRREFTKKLDAGAGDSPKVKVRKEIVNTIGMRFVYVLPGTFMMGSPPDEPGRDRDERQHRVTLTKGFYMQTTEVTQGQWKAIMGYNPSNFKDCGDDCPVEQVSWNEAQEFIKKLNKREETNGYRLPTEAEWEYACRAGTKGPYSFGNCLSTDQANYNGDYPLERCPQGIYRATTIRVGSFPPNDWGLYDMHGSVWEWCQDWYGKYPSNHVTDPKGPSSGSRRVLRGGRWSLGARFCRSANRYKETPDHWVNFLGFRLVRQAEEHSVK